MSERVSGVSESVGVNVCENINEEDAYAQRIITLSSLSCL